MQAGDTFENNTSYASTNSGRADACLVGHVDDDVEVVDDDDDHFADDTASRSSDESGWPRREKRPKAASTPSTPWQSRRARIMQHKQSTKSFSVFKKKKKFNEILPNRFPIFKRSIFLISNCKSQSKIIFIFYSIISGIQG